MDADFREAERECCEDPDNEEAVRRYFRLAKRAGVLREAIEKLTDHVHARDGGTRMVVRLCLIITADEATGNGPEEMQMRDYKLAQQIADSRRVIDYKTGAGPTKE